MARRSTVRLRYQPAVLAPNELDAELAELQAQLKALDCPNPSIAESQMIESLTLDLIALEAAIRRQRAASIQGVLPLGE